MILVTGGAGYIGSVLVEELLEQGHKVRVLDVLLYGSQSLRRFYNHPNFELVQGDCRDAEVVRLAAEGASAVVHLAAIVGVPAGDVDSDLTTSTNFTGAVTTARVAKEVGCKRFIYISTYAVCGNYDGWVDEETPVRPISTYAEAKAAAEQPILALNDDGYAVTVLRLATNYGMSLRPRFDLVVNLLAARAVQEKEFHIFGGQQWRSFMHVKDTARAISQVLRVSPSTVAGQIFCIGSESGNFRLLDIGETISKIVPDAHMIVDPPQDDCNLMVRYNKTRRVLGFRLGYSLPDGVSEIIEAIESGEISNCRDAAYSNVALLQKKLDDIYSNVVIIMLTWCGPPERELIEERLGYGQKTIGSIRKHLKYPHYTWHIADDNSGKIYQERVLAMLGSDSYTFSDTKVGGDVGNNINVGLRAAFAQADVVLLWHDDRWLTYDLDLGPCCKLLREDNDYCLIRLKPQHPGMIVHPFDRHGQKWWRVDKKSTCEHVVDIGPHLMHKRFIEHYGLYPSGLNPRGADTWMDHRFRRIIGPNIAIPDFWLHRTEIPWGSKSTWE
jgi:nucleoside-diphosphate-sugar epimerase